MGRFPRREGIHGEARGNNITGKGEGDMSQWVTSLGGRDNVTGEREEADVTGAGKLHSER